MKWEGCVCVCVCPFSSFLSLRSELSMEQGIQQTSPVLWGSQDRSTSS